MNPIAKKMFSLRKADTRTRVKVGTALIIRDRMGRLLLEKRRDCGMWGLLGGKIEPGESVIQSALREAREETGYRVKITRLIGVYSGPKDRLVIYPDNGDKVHLVDILLEAVVISGKLRCSHESEELKYFDPQSLPRDLIPPSRQLIRDALEKRRGMIR